MSGEYADDLIGKGMMEERPFGYPHQKRAKAWPRTHPRSPKHAGIIIPAKVNDDHFGWWYDSVRGERRNEKMSEYEVAALAWHEAVRRVVLANKQKGDQ